VLFFRRIYKRGRSGGFFFSRQPDTPIKTNGAYTELIDIGPEVTQICHLNHAPHICLSAEAMGAK